MDIGAAQCFYDNSKLCTKEHVGQCCQQQQLISWIIIWTTAFEQELCLLLLWLQ